MDQRVRKLRHFGISPEDAEALVAAGYDLPRKIKKDRTKAGKITKKGLGRLKRQQKG